MGRENAIDSRLWNIEKRETKKEVKIERRKRREKSEMESTEKSVKRAALSQTSPKARFIGVL